MMDLNVIRRAIAEVHTRNPIDTVVMDMHHAEGLLEFIERDIGARIIENPQNKASAAAEYEQFMAALGEGWLRHSGDEGLRGHVFNAVARVLPFGDVRFDRSSTARIGGQQDRRVIDALVAAAMVHNIAVIERNAEPKKRRVTSW